MGRRTHPSGARSCCKERSARDRHEPSPGQPDTSRLLEEVASEANLALELLNVVRNEGAPGVDGQTVQEAEASAPKLLPRLRRALLEGRYRPGDVRRVFIPKPGVNVVDRVVQQAVLQVLEPVFEPTFHTSSHGFRPKRGAHTAIAEAKEHLEAWSVFGTDECVRRWPIHSLKIGVQCRRRRNSTWPRRPGARPVSSRRPAQD
jgi:hypothetical protein